MKTHPGHIFLATFVALVCATAAADPPDPSAPVVKETYKEVKAVHVDLKSMKMHVDKIEDGVAKAVSQLEKLKAQVEKLLDKSPLKIRATCDGQVSVATFCRGNDCEPPLKTPCFPFNCGTRKQAPNACNSHCVTASDCADGAACSSNGNCTAQSSSCMDVTTVKASDGSTESCWPYRCQVGHCTSTCSRAADCAPGAECSSGRCKKK